MTEIQELRHQDLGSNNVNGSSSALSAIIDQALVRLDERLESVAQNISLISSCLEPLSDVPLTLSSKKQGDNTSLMILRKHGALLSEWESVQHEAEVLRDELKEDKWLLVFRTGRSDTYESIEDNHSRVKFHFSKRSSRWDDAFSRQNCRTMQCKDD